MFSSKRTIALIVVLAAITGLLFMTAVSPKKNTSPTSSTNQSTPTQMPAPAETTLSLSPQVIPATNTPTTVNVVINTNTNPVTAVQLEMSYDPQMLTSVDIAPSTFFTNPVILLKKVDAQKGTISFAIALSGNAQAQKGVGNVATITFTPQLPIGGKTQLMFTDRTLVTAEGISPSVLKNSQGATVQY